MISLFLRSARFRILASISGACAMAVLFCLSVLTPCSGDAIANDNPSVVPTADTCTWRLTVTNTIPWLQVRSTPIANYTQSGSAVAPVKICADGSAATTFSLTCASGDIRAAASTAIPRIREAHDSTSGGWFEAPVFKGNGWAVVYHHPSASTAWAADTVRHFTLEVWDTLNAVTLVTYPIDIYRPPLVMVHGLATNAAWMRGIANSWIHKTPLYPSKGNETDFLSGSDSPLISFADYGPGVNDHLAASAGVVRDALLRSIVAARAAGFSAGRLDVLAHSVGGLLVREYIQSNRYRDEINRFVTANTPHSGTQLATWGIHHRDELAGSLSLVRQWFHHAGLDLDGGMIDDLDATGSTIQNDLNGPTLNNHIVASRAVATVASPLPAFYDPGIALVNFISGYEGKPSADTLSNLLFDSEASDEVTPVSSQIGGLESHDTVQAAPHFSMNVQSVRDLLAKLFNASPDSAFDHHGFHPPQLHYRFSEAMRAPDGGASTQSMPGTSLKITSPAPGSIVGVSDTVPISISGSGVTRFTILVECGALQMGSKFIDGASGSWNYKVPLAAVGHVGILVVSADSNGVNGIDTLQCRLRVSTTLIAMDPEPRRVWLRAGETKTFAVFGTFRDTSSRDIVKDDSAIVIVNDTAVAKLVAPGQIKGLRVDTTSIQVTYGGQTTRVFVSVDNPDALANAVDEHATPPVPIADVIDMMHAFPNPAPTWTTVGVRFPRAMPVRFEVTDMIGNVVAVAPERSVDAGYHEFRVATSGLRNGVYLCRLSAAGETKTGVLSVVR